MSSFHLYLKLGIEHIADLRGFDHILFLLALCAVYKLFQWKKVIILVTAFTVGHSLTLVLATLDLIHFSSDAIEFLIPITILLTCIGNLLQKSDKISSKAHFFKYGVALFFGLIHGLGFSFYLRSLLGQEDSIVGPLFAFNIGLELGQLIIVLIVLLITWFLVTILHIKHREWNLVLSGAGAGISLILIMERWPF
jgi:hypothetical protein